MMFGRYSGGQKGCAAYVYLIDCSEHFSACF